MSQATKKEKVIMGGSLITIGVLALMFGYSRKHGWDRDCLIGGTVAIAAGVAIALLEK